jgi:hypothetical protein
MTVAARFPQAVHRLFSAGFAGLGGSTTGRLTWPDDVLAHLEVRGFPSFPKLLLAER